MMLKMETRSLPEFAGLADKLEVARAKRQAP
jgi:hypothetical protein